MSKFTGVKEHNKEELLEVIKKAATKKQFKRKAVTNYANIATFNRLMQQIPAFNICMSADESILTNSTVNIAIQMHILALIDYMRSHEELLEALIKNDHALLNCVRGTFMWRVKLDIDCALLTTGELIRAYVVKNDLI